MCFENGLPRQSADWLAMTGFFDSLRENRLRAVFSLCKKRFTRGFSGRKTRAFVYFDEKCVPR